MFNAQDLGAEWHAYFGARRSGRRRTRWRRRTSRRSSPLASQRGQALSSLLPVSSHMHPLLVPESLCWEAPACEREDGACLAAWGSEISSTDRDPAPIWPAHTTGASRYDRRGCAERCALTACGKARHLQRGHRGQRPQSRSRTAGRHCGGQRCAHRLSPATGTNTCRAHGGRAGGCQGAGRRLGGDSASRWKLELQSCAFARTFARKCPPGLVHRHSYG